jgi:putative transposase
MPGVPHHITQRGNRRQQTFFGDEDYAAYVDLLTEWCGNCGVEVWAYCLMPNHVHLIAVPSSEDGLARAVGEAHRRYTRMINFREGWRGYLWQGRFASFPMDASYLPAAAESYPWSSAAAHVAGGLRSAPQPLSSGHPRRRALAPRDGPAGMALSGARSASIFPAHGRACDAMCGRIADRHESVGGAGP